MKLTPEEIKSGRLSGNTLQSAVEQIKINGFVLFDSVLPEDLVSGLRAAFTEVFEPHVAATDPNGLAVVTYSD